MRTWSRLLFSKWLLDKVSTERARYLFSVPDIVFQDNEAHVSFSDHPGNQRNFKRIDYGYYLMREGVQTSEVKLGCVETLKQISDAFTRKVYPLHSCAKLTVTLCCFC